MGIKKVTIAGGGVLGSQIAYQSAFRGFEVTIWLRSEGSIDRCQPRLDRLHGIYVASLTAMKTDKSKWAPGFCASPDVTAAEIDTLIAGANAAYANLKLTTDWDEAFADADLVIEAVAEVPQQKIDFYTELAKHIPEKTIVVTNSSTLLPSLFAEATGRPEKFLGYHFANNIWIGNTAEIMPHPGTSQEAYDALVQYSRDILMVPIELHKEQPGYVLTPCSCRSSVPRSGSGPTTWQARRTSTACGRSPQAHRMARSASSTSSASPPYSTSRRCT